MSSPGSNSHTVRPKSISSLGQISLEHYVRLIVHRRLLILSTCLIVTAITAVVVSRLPNIYTSETLILVDPQKVPDSYVRATVTGDVRNRLSTLEQQILSATRLQKIIDTLKLYPEERKKMTREEIIGVMRKDIKITLVSDFSRQQDTLQAFKISFSGKEPRLVARVVGELAALFIDENLKAREQQATGTKEFLDSQLQDTRKALEAQETKLRDFRLRHLGEMPEQQVANLQILGQLQSQLHLVGEAMARAEQQRNMTQALMSQSAPVLDFDDGEVKGPGGPESKVAGGAKTSQAPIISKKQKLAAELNEKLNRKYTENHPDIKRLRRLIAQEEANEPKPTEVKAEVKPPAEPPKEVAAVPTESVAARQSVPLPPASRNPVLVTQLKTLDAEIAKQREEQKRLSKQLGVYQAKLEAIPIREQEVTELVRDYEISKAHYSQLLGKQLSAETATQLEIRQKGEKFSILDPAQPAEKPSKPNRKLLDAAGVLAGLVLGVVLALATEVLGMSITVPEQLTEISGFPVLEVIPIIETQIDRRRRKKRLVWATVSGALMTVLAGCAVLFNHYQG